MKCTSCNKDISQDGIGFKCPQCKKRLTRCNNCRSLIVKYKCECGFEGP
ncbi:RNA-binding protein [Candidatus Pacearchaeota archaeon]|nr:RNA-binding protein [Candidatus Pacearchaeota archaeon]